MKQLFRRLASALCAGLMLTALPCSAVRATEAEIKLPSGMTLKNVRNELDSLAEKNGDTPFAAALVGIFRGDDILHTGYYGYADIENNIPADENSCFEWGSISKTFIWVSAFQLWEQGRLDLDRDVREYLPQGFFQHLSYDEPITMLHLMNHSAGWQETARPIWKNDVDSIGSLHDELQAIEPAQIHRPGEVYAYSNYGAAVAGYVIECITGQDYCEYVHEHIFEPLGMDQTALNPAHTDNAFVFAQRQRMHSYSQIPFTFKESDLGTKLEYVACYPAGAACGTLSDMIRYGQALVDDSAPLFQDPETQKQMLTGTAFYGTSDIPMCCHGFWCTEHKVRTYGHTGGTLFGLADLEFDPVSKFGIAVMINERDGNAFYSSLPERVFGQLDPETYGANPQGKTDVRGNFLPARSNYTGMLRYLPYLTAISDRQLDLPNVDELGNNVMQQRNDATGAVLGKRYDSNGQLLALESPSCDLLPDRSFLAKLILLTMFMIGGVSACYLLLIGWKLKRAGRWKHYTAEKAILAGRIARIVSVVLMLSTYIVYARHQGGIPYNTGQMIGIGQILCITVCTAAILVCITAMLSKNENRKPLRYLPHCLMNVFSITTVLFFEMYKYWGF